MRRLPLATGKSRCDLLKQPLVSVRILERGKLEVRTTLRVAPADAWIVHGVVEGTACVVEDFAHVNAACDQVVAGGVDVVHGEDEAVRRVALVRRHSLAEDDRGLRIVRPPALAIISTLTLFDASSGNTASSLVIPGAKRLNLYCAASMAMGVATSCECAGAGRAKRETRNKIVSVMALIFMRYLLLITGIEVSFNYYK